MTERQRPGNCLRGVALFGVADQDFFGQLLFLEHKGKRVIKRHTGVLTKGVAVPARRMPRFVTNGPNGDIRRLKRAE